MNDTKITLSYNDIKNRFPVCHEGGKDGLKDCQAGADANAISAYQQSSAYLGHSKYYQQGYDYTTSNCNSFGGGDESGDSGGSVIPAIQNSHQQQDNIITQGQSNKQKSLCIGMCNGVGLTSTRDNHNN